MQLSFLERMDLNILKLKSFLVPLTSCCDENSPNEMGFSFLKTPTKQFKFELSSAAKRFDCEQEGLW